MKSSLIVLGMMVSTVAFAKTTTAPDIRYTKGVLKKISCRYSGTHSQTSTVGSFNFKDAENTVCDPLTNNSATSPANGLLAKLYLKSDAMDPKNKSVIEYYNHGLAMDKKIYFADVNVPTQPFTKGFSTISGDSLVDAQGNKVIENFALEYTSVLQLADGQAEGDYEIASLADDGSRLFVKENNIWNELINNDGEHSTRMGCPFRTISLKKDSKIPIKLLYYQGPRYHIANVLIWKKHSHAQTWKEPSRHSLCGYAGNNYFYNSTTSKKSIGMTFLEFTGWKVIGANNFKMPEQTSNPCTVDPLTLTKFAVASMSGTSATLTWETNAASSSQLSITNAYTGEQMSTDLDSTLVTSHTAKLDGLVSGMYYQVQAISVDAKGREIRSSYLYLAP